MKPLIKKGIIIFIAIAAIALIYKLFFGGDGASVPTGGLVSTVDVAQSSDAPLLESSVGSELLSTLLNLRTIKLNEQIFSNPSFTSLQDFTITLAGNTPQGRSNPFAPIGIDPAVVTTPNSGGGTTPQAPSQTVTTAPVSNISKNTALLNGVIANNSVSFQAWFEWSVVGAVTPTKTTPVSFAGSVTSFSTPVLSLIPNTDYTVKAFVKIGNLTLQGASVAFKTPLQ